MHLVEADGGADQTKENRENVGRTMNCFCNHTFLGNTERGAHMLGRHMRGNGLNPEDCLHTELTNKRPRSHIAADSEQ
ncbi:hypothetical protein E2C01_085268 [Portunus trituberculatus]|uniref:Uncharacterized protein n=1 Tax=Portunus trituberculatus TaxID=210409 RepID=A0A5B7IXE0_PORTR|nr:hypothetical protein [Portunus trituberculatus]